MNELEAGSVSREAFNKAVAQAKGRIGYKQRAYKSVFNKENIHLKEVLRDLGKFCRANVTTFNPDPRVHAALEGRREVWLRIVTHLKLSEDELFLLLGGKDNG